MQLGGGGGTWWKNRMREIDKTLNELTACNFNEVVVAIVHKQMSSSCYGFAAHHRVLSAFSYITRFTKCLYSYISRFTKCHRLLVNPGRLLKKIRSATKQGNCVLTWVMLSKDEEMS